MTTLLVGYSVMRQIGPDTAETIAARLPLAEAVGMADELQRANPGERYGVARIDIVYVHTTTPERAPNDQSTTDAE